METKTELYDREERETDRREVEDLDGFSKTTVGMERRVRIMLERVKKRVPTPCLVSTPSISSRRGPARRR